MPPEIPRRPKTPSDEHLPSRPKTPSDNRPKTPTRLALQGGNNSRPSVNAPNSAHLPRREFPDNSRDYNDDSFNNTNAGRPPIGPRNDPFGHMRGRSNYSNLHDRDPYGRTDSARPGQFRSRTPGPEMMQRSQFPDYRPDPSRPKTPTAMDMRSKTPIPGLYGHVPGGNSEYARNSGWGNNSVPFRNYDASNSRTWGSSIPENSVTPNMQRRGDMSDFNRVNSSVSVGAGRPPQQSSSSFESDEPLSRIPRRQQFHNASFPGPQSPKPFRYPGNTEDNQKYIEMNVTLQRQESGFGFRIIGGTEEGSQVIMETGALICI